MKNIVNILKYFPTGAVLYSPMVGNVVLKHVDDKEIQVRELESDTWWRFNQYGQLNKYGKCMLLPIEGKPWDEYNEYVKPGDIVYGRDENRPFMFGGYCTFGKPIALCGFNFYQQFVVHAYDSEMGGWTNETSLRIAPIEQANRIRQALTERSMYWDKTTNRLLTTTTLPPEEPASEKFDYSSFQPFDKVVVRNIDSTWTPHFFSERVTLNQVSCIGDNGWYTLCVPYNEETKKLIGTCDPAPVKYAWWAKK